MLFNLTRYCMLICLLATQVVILANANEEAAGENKKEKIYKVGLPHVPGFMERDKDGKPKGFVLEVFESIAKSEGLKYKWIDGTWNELFQKIKSGEIDALPGTQVTKERREFLDFLDVPFYSMWSNLYLREGTKFDNLVVLTGKTVGLVKGGNNSKGFLDYIKDFHIDFKTKYYDSHPEALEALRSGEVFAVPGPTSSMISGKIEGLMSSGLFFNPTALSVSFPKGKNPELVNDLNTGFKKAVTDPQSFFHKLAYKYKVLKYKPVPSFIPDWIKTALATTGGLVVLAIIFVVVLKYQLKRQAQQLSINEHRNALAMQVGGLGAWEWQPVDDIFIPSERLIEIYAKCFDSKYNPEMSYDNILEVAKNEIVDSIKDSVIDKGLSKFSIEHCIPKSKSSDEIWHLLIGAVSKYNDDGEALQVIGYTQDITEKISKENQFRQMQKMDAIGQLAGGVAHDFNNMLCGIMGAAELLGKWLPDNPKAMNLQKMIVSTGERAADLTGQLLAFSRRQHIASSVIDVHQVITDSVDLLKRTLDRRVDIELDLSASSALVIGDPSQLQSAFMNLGINAAHAMPEGGMILFQTSIVTFDSLFCKSSMFDLEPGQFLEIRVQDNGCGISPMEIEKIFEPFFTTKEEGEGTGLGLAAVFGTVQQHNGAIHVTSELGQGSCFSIHLPLETSEDISSAVEMPEKTVTGSGTILVIDDEKIMRLTARDLLRDLGYEVFLAKNGREGLEMFKQSPERFNIVLIDMIMPVMNGKDCFFEMKKIKPDVRVVLASGFTQKGNVEQMKDQGLSAFIMKPYRGYTLGKTIHDVLNN